MWKQLNMLPRALMERSLTANVTLSRQSAIEDTTPITDVSSVAEYSMSTSPSLLHLRNWRDS